MNINRKNDYLFKRIFGKEDTKDVLADFLSAVLDMPIKPSELILTHTEQSRDYKMTRTLSATYKFAEKATPKKR